MLVDATHRLPDGRRVRLRVPQGTDRPALLALHERAGVPVSDLELSRALRFDPRSRAVVCATLWVRGAEVLVGYGAKDRGADAIDTLVFDARTAPGLGGVIAAALLRRAAAA